ncbi:hypothetical protein RvY_11395 [Ramazzottius varieornatus]|uniref:Uncharacterized protein n=1 Tax=Ramazzottius varieornatus TaxID=947166 RepID=A0A1D1VLF5_RAMVA|nr:hypothetical protein RvY_11395 [Ramazzottius varieornatus]
MDKNGTITSVWASPGRQFQSVLEKQGITRLMVGDRFAVIPQERSVAAQETVRKAITGME